MVFNYAQAACAPAGANTPTSTWSWPPRLFCATLALGLALALSGPAWGQEHGEEHGAEQGAEAGHHPGMELVPGGHGEQGGDAHAGAGGAHGGGHGGQKHMSDVNWFSFDYGHGTRADGTAYAYPNPPLGFAIVNFIILIALLVKFTRKPLAEYLVARSDSVRKALEEAGTLRDRAQAKLREIDAKLGNLDAEVAQIKADVAKDAEQEKARIIKAAQAEADRLVKLADITLQRELRRARRMLEKEAVEGALKAAEELVKKNINEADRKRLNEEFIAQVDAPGGAN